MEVVEIGLSAPARKQGAELIIDARLNTLLLKYAITQPEEARPGFQSLEESAQFELEVSDQKSEVRKIRDLEAALAQFAAVTDAKQRPGFPIGADFKACNLLFVRAQ